MDPDPNSFFTFARSNVWIDNCTRIRIHLQCQKITGVADPDPGSRAFYTQGSEKGFLGSRSHIFESLVIIFGGRKFYNSFGMDKKQNKVWISKNNKKLNQP